MKNQRFYQLLHMGRQANGEAWTTSALAASIQSGRAHVTEVLNNEPGHGHQTRRKLAAVFKANFTFWRDLLLALGWDEGGNILAVEGRLMESHPSPSAGDSFHNSVNGVIGGHPALCSQ